MAVLPFSLLAEQMLQEDFNADHNQDCATEQLRLGGKDGAELFAQKNAGQADDKSDDADEGDRQQHQQSGGRSNGGGKDDPGGQRVDAGGDRHGDEHFKADRFAAVTVVLRLLFDGFIDHLSADVTQQDKSDPMVQLTDDPFARLADQPADDGHDRLKDAEAEGDAQGVLQTDVPGHGAVG